MEAPRAGRARRARAADRGARRLRALRRHRGARQRVVHDRRAGNLLGLIGPNGAGKTTLFNCFQPPLHAGLRRHRVRGPHASSTGRRTASPTSASAARSRTSRCSAPCRCSTMCASAATRSATPISSRNALKLPWTRREEQALADIAWELIEFLDLDDVAHRRVADLPFGMQKRVELARALAARPKLLLLDEPAGGLNHTEINGLGELIQRIRDERRHHDPAGRASHEHGDVDLRQGGGARLRQEDRRGHAGAGAERRGRDPRLSRDHANEHSCSKRATSAPITGRRRCCSALGLDVDDGGITTLLGANGAGKTTTLRSLSGMCRTIGRNPLRRQADQRPRHRRHRAARHRACAAGARHVLAPDRRGKSRRSAP